MKNRNTIFTTILLLFGCCGVSPRVQALLPPPAPDGGYLNGNTAEGTGALFSLTTGSDNTAIGFDALDLNTMGAANTAIGFGTLTFNTTGHNNTATGFEALEYTTGNDNTATGYQALLTNQTGNNNTADGVNALFSNTTGNNNTASGFSALVTNTSGHDNTAEGFQALANNKTGSNNIALGSNAGANLTTGSNDIDIGAPAVAAEANTIRIGKSGTQNKTFIAGISGKIVAGGVGVIIGSSGQLGTVLSSARFKEAIKPMDKASEAILALKPVTFRYKAELDPDRIPQFGLVAEDVEKIDPDLVVRGEDGKVMTVRYEAVNMMLLNEFLKAHCKVEEQEAAIAHLKASMAQQQVQIEALNTTVQKVSNGNKIEKSASEALASN